ncbi:MAG TPA: hypothetical protein VE782_14005 [Myxococcaceae bacterium]|nr:hypothetical protein [Myxococcaceae bacterium]
MAAIIPQAEADPIWIPADGATGGIRREGSSCSPQWRFPARESGLDELKASGCRLAANTEEPSP